MTSISLKVMPSQVQIPPLYKCHDCEYCSLCPIPNQHLSCSSFAIHVRFLQEIKYIYQNMEKDVIWIKLFLSWQDTSLNIQARETQLMETRRRASPYPPASAWPNVPLLLSCHGSVQNLFLLFLTQHRETRKTDSSDSDYMHVLNSQMMFYVFISSWMSMEWQVHLYQQPLGDR